MTKAKAKGTNLFKLLETDPDLEAEGVWCAYPGTQSRFKVRSLEGSDAEKYRQKLIQERVEEIREGGESQRVALTDIAQSVLSDVLVADWDGVLGDDDQPLPFSIENCRLLLARVRPVRSWLERQCASTETYLLRKDVVGSGN